MSAPSFNTRKSTYTSMWNKAVTNSSRRTQADNAAKLVLKNKEVYKEVEKRSGVPWAFVGVLHYREAACNMQGILHNGEKIIGSGKKTRLVPKGRGPFNTWMSSAVDALSIKGLKKGAQVWSVEMCLYQGERYNGWGYFYKKTPSAYLWSGTNQYTKGKYVADHVWDGNAVDKQMGIVPVMKRLQELDKEVSWGTPLDVFEPEVKNIDLDDSLSSEEIKSIQRRLRELGYSEVGWIDGLWGNRTESGVRAFQINEGLPTTGIIDEATLASLAIAAPRKVGEIRGSITSSELKKAGDQVVKSSWITRLVSWFLGGSALGVGALDSLPSAASYVGSIQSVISGVPPWGWSIILILLAVIIWRETTRIDKAKVEDIRSGRDAGPIIDIEVSNE